MPKNFRCEFLNMGAMRGGNARGELRTMHVPDKRDRESESSESPHRADLSRSIQHKVGRAKVCRVINRGSHATQAGRASTEQKVPRVMSQVCGSKPRGPPGQQNANHPTDRLGEARTSAQASVTCVRQRNCEGEQEGSAGDKCSPGCNGDSSSQNAARELDMLIIPGCSPFKYALLAVPECSSLQSVHDLIAVSECLLSQNVCCLSKTASLEYLLLQKACCLNIPAVSQIASLEYPCHRMLAILGCSSPQHADHHGKELRLVKCRPSPNIQPPLHCNIHSIVPDENQDQTPTLQDGVYLKQCRPAPALQPHVHNNICNIVTVVDDALHPTRHNMAQRSAAPALRSPLHYDTCNMVTDADDALHPTQYDGLGASQCRSSPTLQSLWHYNTRDIVTDVTLTPKELSKRRKKEAGLKIKERRTIEVGRSTHTKKRVHRTEKGISKVKGRERIGTKAEPTQPAVARNTEKSTRPKR